MSRSFHSQHAARSPKAVINATEAEDEKGTYRSLHQSYLGLAKEK